MYGTDNRIIFLSIDHMHEHFHWVFYIMKSQYEANVMATTLSIISRDASGKTEATAGDARICELPE